MESYDGKLHTADALADDKARADEDQQRPTEKQQQGSDEKEKEKRHPGLDLSSEKEAQERAASHQASSKKRVHKKKPKSSSSSSSSTDRGRKKMRASGVEKELAALKAKMRKWRHKNPEDNWTMKWNSAQKLPAGPAKKQAKELVEKGWRSREEVALRTEQTERTTDSCTSCSFLDLVKDYELKMNGDINAQVAKVMLMGQIKRKRLSKTQVKGVKEAGLPECAEFMYLKPHRRLERCKLSESSRGVVVDAAALSSSL